MKPKKNFRNYPVFGAPPSLRANRFNQYKCKILSKRWFSDKRGDCAHLGQHDRFSSLGFWMGKITLKTVVPPFCQENDTGKLFGRRLFSPALPKWFSQGMVFEETATLNRPERFPICSE